jgi:hypothetical protein
MSLLSGIFFHGEKTSHGKLQNRIQVPRNNGGGSGFVVFGVSRFND